LVITLPVSVVKNPHVEGSMDMQFSKATQFLNQKKYLQSLKYFNKCEVSLKMNRFSMNDSAHLINIAESPSLVGSSSSVSSYKSKDIEYLINNSGEKKIEPESKEECSKHEK
jgi:hypothetical protein